MKTLLVLVASLQATSSLFVGTDRSVVSIRSLCSNVKEATTTTSTPCCGLFMARHDAPMDRRSVLSVVATTKILPIAAIFSKPLSAAWAQDGGNTVVVFGGSGYVGAHVDRLLSEQGYKVISVARSSPSDQKSKVSQILNSGSLSNVEYVSLDASKDDLSGVLQGAQAVVSCVGATPGGPNQREGNGAVNVRIADAAKAAGIKRFVYISVASSLANGPAKFLLGDYFKGKAEAEAAVLRDFEEKDRLVVKPTFIGGGPPGELRPPGPPGVKPASVESVAKVVVAGALGRFSGTIDGNDAIAAF